MANQDAGQVDRSNLAEEARPVRRWLTRYFRRRIQDYAEVEDMVQDVFTRMVAREGSEPVEHLGGYVMKTASSVLADRARLRATHGAGLHVALDEEMHGEDEIDPARIVGARQDLQAATAALLGLPERTRTIFILRRLEGQAFRDIASRVGISVSAVEKHMVRAINHLTLEMEKRRDT